MSGLYFPSTTFGSGLQESALVLRGASIRPIVKPQSTSQSMALLALAATAVLTLLGSHSVATFVLSKAPATWPDQSIPPLLLAIALSTCVLWTTSGIGSFDFHAHSPPRPVLSEERSYGYAEATSASARLTEDVRKLQVEVLALRGELVNKREPSDLKDNQIQTSTNRNMESHAAWPETESALQDSNKSLRQAVAEQMALVAQLEARNAKLEELCGSRGQAVKALAERCAAKERQIMSLNQAITEHERNTTSADKYEQTIAELNDKLGEYSRALVAAGSYPDPSSKLLPPPAYYPSVLPLVPNGPRRPMTSVR